MMKLFKKAYLLGFMMAFGEAITVIKYHPEVRQRYLDSKVPKGPVAELGIATAAGLLWPVGVVVNLYRKFS